MGSATRTLPGHGPLSISSRSSANTPRSSDPVATGWLAARSGERTPSLSVSPEKGVYYCRGRAATRSRSFRRRSRLRRSGGISAGRYGIQLRYTSAGEGQRRGPQKGLQEAVGEGRSTSTTSACSAVRIRRRPPICAVATTGSSSVTTRSAGRPTIGTARPPCPVERR